MNKSDDWKLEFIAVGPMKTGTSWLHEYFTDHPDISVPATVKETYFFSRHYGKGYDWYKQQFKNTSTQKLKGEVGPTYFPDHESIVRLKQLNPHLKIIITLREPIDRFLSHYNHLVDAGLITELDDPYEKTYEKRRLLREHSCYYTFINEWIEHFGIANTLILFYEDLKNQPQLVANNCCQFLGIDNYIIPTRLNARVGARRKPKNPRLVKATKRMAKWLRGHDFHGVVNKMKVLRIDSVLYNNSSTTKKKSNPENDAQISLLFQKMQNEILPLENELSIDIQKWKNIWVEKNLDT